MSKATINLNGGDTVYLLLGTEACNEYEDNGIDGVVSRYEDNDLMYGHLQIREGDTLFSVLNDMDGWMDWRVITAEEYALL
jgi:hypothetical protein